MTTTKLNWNSILSTPKVRYMCLNISNFYLTATLDPCECMKMPISLCPPWIITQYGLLNKVVGGYVYLRMRKAVWGLPQAGILAKYYECKNTPGFWKHTSQHISFTLIIVNFGVKYEHKEDNDHLIKALKTKYTLTKDWMGDLYCGIKLNWNYDKCTLDILMPRYIVKQLQCYKHASPTCPQNCPLYPQPKQYGSAAQQLIKPDTSSALSNKDIKQVQHIIGSILYYACTVNLTILMVLIAIASEQAKGTESTMKKCKQLLDY